jgi:hypothetical protein
MKVGKVGTRSQKQNHNKKLKGIHGFCTITMPPG